MKTTFSTTTPSVVGLCLILLFVANPAWGDSDFQRWVRNFFPKATAAGVSRETYDRAFATVHDPDPKVLEKANYQPEFTTEIWDYLDARINPKRIQMGLEKCDLYSQTLKRIESRFGVESSVLLAIWAMESNYGEIFDRPERLHSVIGALATLAYGDKKRKKFAETQLIAALKILQRGDVSLSRMSGSWAGAMGHTQFIPTSYLAYGVDLDEDGRSDIWDSIPDALATAANLLSENGWQTGKTWGYEVRGPRGEENFKDQTQTLGQWQKLGFSRPSGKGFPRPGDKAVLKVFAGKEGSLFLMLRNFFVLKRYNNSNFYALSVGLMADRLAGFQGLVQPWPRPAGSLTIEEKFELQTHLKRLKLYDGGIDGDLGKGSREAIKTFQRQLGKEANGLPTFDLLNALRRHVR